MSDQQELAGQKAEGQPVDDVKEQGESFEQLQERLNQLQSSNQRLLEESKANAAKYRELRDKREQEENELLQEQNKWKELYEKETSTKTELMEKMQAEKTARLKDRLAYEVSKHATDAFSMDDVVAFLPKEEIEYDETTLTLNKVDEAVSKLREAKPYLFKSAEVPGEVGKRPLPAKEKTLKDLSIDQKLDKFGEGLTTLWK